MITQRPTTRERQGIRDRRVSIPYHIPSSQSMGIFWEREQKDSKSQRHWMTSPEHRFQAWQVCCTCEPTVAMTVCIRPSQEQTSQTSKWLGERFTNSHPLDEELLALDGCCEGGNKFSSETWFHRCNPCYSRWADTYAHVSRTKWTLSYYGKNTKTWMRIAEVEK